MAILDSKKIQYIIDILNSRGNYPNLLKSDENGFWLDIPNSGIRLNNLGYDYNHIINDQSVLSELSQKISEINRSGKSILRDAALMEVMVKNSTIDVQRNVTQSIFTLSFQFNYQFDFIPDFLSVNNPRITIKQTWVSTEESSIRLNPNEIYLSGNSIIGDIPINIKISLKDKTFSAQLDQGNGINNQYSISPFFKKLGISYDILNNLKLNRFKFEGKFISKSFLFNIGICSDGEFKIGSKTLTLKNIEISLFYTKSDKSYSEISLSTDCLVANRDYKVDLSYNSQEGWTFDANISFYNGLSVYDIITEISKEFELTDDSNIPASLRNLILKRFSFKYQQSISGIDFGLILKLPFRLDGIKQDSPGLKGSNDVTLDSNDTSTTNIRILKYKESGGRPITEASILLKQSLNLSGIFAAFGLNYDVVKNIGSYPILKNLRLEYSNKESVTPTWIISANAIFKNGLELDAIFESRNQNTVIVCLLADELSISAKKLLSNTSSNIASSLPIDFDFKLKEFLFGYHKTNSNAQNVKDTQGKATTNSSSFIFRTTGNFNTDLSGIPLIGKSLPKDIGIQDIQIFASNEDLFQSELNAYNEVIQQLNSSTSPITAYPKNVAPDPLVNKGVSLGGTFKIGSQTYPLFVKFGSGKSSTKDSSSKENANVSDNSLSNNNAGPEAQQTIDQKGGGVTFNKISLIFEKEKVGFVVSATLSLTGFELDLMGFGLSLPKEVLKDPNRIKDIQFNLDGLGLDIERGPLTLSLAFLRKTFKDSKGNNYDEFAGLVRLAFKDIQLAGVGAYAMYEGKPSLYLFAALGMPFGGPPAFFVLGLMAGFGVNRDFICPPISEVANFPLIQMAQPFQKVGQTKSDLDSLMDKLHVYLPPRIGEYWIAAGIRFKSFGLIDTLAMAAVKFGQELEVDVLGVSSLMLPTLFVELQFSIRYVPAQGYISIQGQLTSRSYMYAPVVHLTGGFAAVFWYDGEHKGDYVVSIGGYHPKFEVPSYYPQNIPRLGLNWQLSDVFSIKGGFYFAITPNAIMAGGFWEAIFDTGLLYAFLRISADFIIYYSPFHYDAEISIEVHVKVSVNVGLFVIHINISISSDLHIWGPDFSGTASLDVGIKTFDISFGANASQIPPPISWDDFNKKYIPESGPVTLSIIAGVQKSVKFKIDNELREIFIVNPKELKVLVDSIVPMSNLFVANDSIDNSGILNAGVAPMNRKSFSATGKIEVSFYDELKKSWIRIESDFKSDRLLKNVPKAIWGDSIPSKEVKSQSEGLLHNALSGVVLKPGKEPIGGISLELSKSSLSFETLNSKFENPILKFNALFPIPAETDKGIQLDISKWIPGNGLEFSTYESLNEFINLPHEEFEFNKNFNETDVKFMFMFFPKPQHYIPQ